MAGYSVAICQDCGCGFADDIPPQKDFDRYYRRMSKYEFRHREGREYQADRDRHDFVAGLIARWLPDRQARCVDIGCSNGGLLSALRNRGYEHVFGVDPSAACCEAARRLYGVDVRKGTIASFPRFEKPFDLAVLTGVLEHLRDHVPLMRRLLKILAPGAHVLIGVPDATLFTRWTNAPFQQFSIEHVNFFSPASLRNLFRRFGLSQAQLVQHDQVWQPGTTDPVLAALFRNDGGSREPLVPDRQTDRELRAYIRQSQALDRAICRKIDALVKRARPILVWGAGPHTLRLLRISTLRDARIKAIVDSNPRYHRRRIAGIPVLAPGTLRSDDTPILISTRAFQRDIERQIRYDLRLQNPLVLLYDDV
jgi:SAM-dependent methyltransferase